MVVNQKPTGRATSIPGGLLFGAAISLGITLLAAAVLAKLVASEILEEKNIGYGVMLMLLIGAYTGALGAYGKVKRQRLKVCLLSGVVYFGILLSITALFFGGQYEAVGVTAILVLGGSMTAGLLGLRQNRGGKKRKIRILNR